MRLRKIVLAGCCVLGGTVGWSTTAYAEGSVSPSTAAGPTTPVTVTWSGLAVNDVVFVMQCVKTDEDATFNQATDCSQATYQNFLTGPEGQGSGEFVMFGGDEPNGEPWGCGPLTSTPNRADVCFVRLTTGTVSNLNSEFIPVKFASDTQSSSGTPRLVLFTSSAIAAMVVAMYFIYRSNRTKRNYEPVWKESK